MKNKHFKIALWLLLFIPLFFCSCKEEGIDQNLFAGLWVQEKMTVDGQEVDMTDKEKSLKLLVESNGVYRSYATDGVTPEEYYGTWFVTDNKWIDFTSDIWHIKTQPTPEKPNGEWGMNHIPVRFSILSINSERMEIRIKTYVGEKKYSPVFVAGDRPNITLSNLNEIEEEYKTIKTYIFTFVKSAL